MSLTETKPLIFRVFPIFLLVLISLFPTVPVFSAGVEDSLVFDAALAVENDVEVKTRITGIVSKIFVDRGQWVKKGDALAELDNRDLLMEVKKAEAAMQESNSEFKRAQSLFDQKLLSESQYDSIRLNHEKMIAELELTKINQEWSMIRAPFPGIVVEKFVKIGQRVVEDENVALFRITALEPLQARVFVSEENLPKLSIGMKSEFIPNLWPDRRFAARVKWISSTIDPASGTAPAIVELASGEGRGLLKPGSSGKIVIWTKQQVALKGKAQ